MTTGTKLPVILPVETHVRELDGKLLLACVAAESGREAFIGSQNEIRARIGQLPRGVFIAKGFASSKARFLDILKQLGFVVFAWDEEGLVHPEPAIYYKRRISPQSLAYLEGVFSWGPDYTQLFRDMPFYDGTPVYETGNPRIDLLDKRVRDYFRPEADKRRADHGRYILLNSNFGRVNSAVKRSRDKGVAGKLTDPVLDKKWQEMVEYRRTLYGHFREMFEGVAKAFPDRQVILRPHPSERIESWADIPARCPNAHVIYEGNVLPWLLGAEILVHNGCTTAIESALLDKPVIAYQPITSEVHDWHLPNSVSHPVPNLAALVETIENHLSGTAPLKVTPAQRHALDPFVHSDKKALASDLIIHELDSLDAGLRREPGKATLMSGRLRAGVRALEKKLRSYRPGDIYAPWHQDKHFPDYTCDELAERIGRLRSATGRFKNLNIEKIAYKIFRVTQSG